ncbi:MAG: pitrilysin family protein [Deltaproteobacteria bacterium]|nr:pitrilysin family protein [Deltaproteobacteria bacterium]
MIQKTTLANGIQVITEEIPHVHSVSVGVWVETGSRDESRGENGISHFIEHMLFKGTKRRSAQQIAKEIDAVGGILNAFTSKEFSSFYAKILAEHLPVALDLLFDLFLHSRFAGEEIEKERQVILQEVNMVEDTPDEYIHDLFGQSFWPRHSLGLPILGSAETIAKMNRKNLVDFFRRHHLHHRPVLVAAGKLKHDQLLKPVREVLGGLKLQAKTKKSSPPRSHPQVLVKNKKLEQAHLLLGTQGLAATDPKRYAFSILNTILGGGMSSRLFQEIREKRGLAYSVYSFVSTFLDSGIIGIYVGTGDKSVPAVLKIILKEIKRLGENSLRPKELQAAKEQLKGNLLMSLENTDSRMNRLAKSEIYFHRFVKTEEIIEKIEKVTADEVIRLAEQLFQTQALSLTVLGPVTEKTIPREFFQA